MAASYQGGAEINIVSLFLFASTLISIGLLFLVVERANCGRTGGPFEIHIWVDSRRLTGGDFIRQME